MTLNQNGDRQIGPNPRQFLVEDTIGQAVDPRATVLFGKQAADEPEFLDLGEQALEGFRIRRMAQIFVFFH